MHCIFQLHVPESKHDSSVLLDADHSVFDSNVLEVGVLVIGEVGVRQPQFVGDPAVDGHHGYVVTQNVSERETVVPPVLTQVDCQGEVLN